MTSSRLATIDIGTNSVLLLIAQIAKDGSITVLEEQAEITQLGEGFATDPTIRPAVFERNLTVLKKFAERCRVHAVNTIKVVATEGMRRARNSKEFIAAVKTQTGFEIEIISGEREAELTYKAAAHDFGADITVMDIGGGSTEFIAKNFSTSIPMGSVILTEQFLQSDPPTESEYKKLVDYIETNLKKNLTIELLHHRTIAQFVATAGTATTVAAMHLKLATYDQAKVHGTSISRQNIESILDQIKSMPLAERITLPGLHPKRAPFIIAGTTLLLKAMEFLGFDTVTVSDRGLRWGMLYSIIGYVVVGVKC
ncbi:MAG: Ppx/GppA family phosphatase [Deltaproteobacteria bacterium]|nr:Ppx/GppA family phosphatase [Deltaproteobacteria bacterium]